MLKKDLKFVKRGIFFNSFTISRTKMLILANISVHKNNTIYPF